MGLWGKPSHIVSVQTGTATLTAGNATGTATITAVSLFQTVLNYLNAISTDAAVVAAEVKMGVTLTNATTVTFTRTSTGVAATGRFQLVTYVPGVLRSVQRGTIVLSAVTSNTATIAAVNTTKYRLVMLGWYNAEIQVEDDYTDLALTNATTLTATRGSGSGTSTVSYQIEEYW